MDQAHKIYEEIRLVGTTQARKTELNNVLKKVYEDVPAPSGWEQIEKLNTFKEYLAELGIDLI